MNLNKTVVFFAVLSCSLSVFANTNDDIMAYQAQGKAVAAQVSPATLSQFKMSSVQSQAQNKPLIDTIMQQARASLPQKQQAQAAPDAVLFVSFSMPDPLLFQLANEAARLDIPVVLNGLVDGDFKKTIEKFASLNKKAKKQHLNFQGVSIDPVWFEQFKISAVPALVVSPRPASCEAQTVCANRSFDVVYGNASLKNSLELIAEKGEHAVIVQNLLEQGHG